MRVNVTNLGCKVNRVESDLITQALIEKGFQIVEQEYAEAIVINTCAVTAEAEKKTRKAIRHAHNLNHNPLVVVTGCAVNLHESAYQALGQRVYTQSDKTAVAPLVCDVLGVTELEKPAGNLGGLGEDLKNSAREYSVSSTTHGGISTQGQAFDHFEGYERRRIGIKVQDGCDNRCTYCIIWKARGNPCSVEPDEVLRQINAAVDRGVHEVVLTGINLGSYSSCDPDTGDQIDLSDLLTLIMIHTALLRVRLSSVEPLDADDKLLSVMAAHPERICPHLHLALQSGCDKTLEEMARIYTTQQFREVVSHARKVLPNISLSTDLIVGFPGETDEDFEQTYAFCKEMGFSKIHTFRYSARPGTPAAQRLDQVDPETVAKRSRLIRTLQDEMRHDDAAQRVGMVESVLIEDGRTGTSHSYHRVCVQGFGDVTVDPGDLVYARFDRVDTNGLIYATYLSKYDSISSKGGN